MKKINLIILCLIWITACTEENDFPFNNNNPLAQTLEIQDLNTSGVTLRAEIISRGTQEVLSYGFIWEHNNRSYRKKLDGTFGGDFSYRVTSDLKAGLEVEYRAFVETPKATYFGNPIRFSALGASQPVITGVNDQNVSRGDEVIVYVNHLSNRSERNQVILNDKAVPTSQVANNALKFTIPDDQTQFFAKIKVKAGDLISDEYDELVLTGPKITAISSDNLRPMDIVTVYAEEFGSPGEKIVSFNNSPAQILEEGDGYAKIVVPEATGIEKILFLEVNGIMGDIAKAPRVFIQPLWQEVTTISRASFPIWFNYKNNVYRAELFSGTIWLLDKNTYSLTQAINVIPAEMNLYLPGDDILYRIWRDNDDNVHLSELNVTNGTETFIRLLDFNGESTNFRAYNNAEFAWLVSNSKTYQFNMASTTITALPDQPSRGVARPFVWNSELNLLTADRMQSLNLNTLQWNSIDVDRIYGGIVDEIIYYDNTVIAFVDNQMYRWYPEYQKWAYISVFPGGAEGHYFNNELHVIFNDGTIRKIIE